MRISQLDRRRAISRLPEFKTDYELYKTLESEDEIIRKEYEIQQKWGYSIESIKCADEVAKQKGISPAIRDVTSITQLSQG